MTENPNNALNTFLYPYTFILQEGKQIKKDLLDYSLMIMLTHPLEIIHSPESELETLSDLDL